VISGRTRDSYWLYWVKLQSTKVRQTINVVNEALNIELHLQCATYAGALARRGEATAEVTATGGRTKFGRTAELVQTAHSISSQQTPVVEEWLKDLKFDTTWRQKKAVRLARKEKEKENDMHLLAPASKARIRDLMSVLFNHAIRWQFTDRNPISGPNKGAGVRQSSKRQSVPDILEVSEIQAIVAELQLRERVLLFLDMATGLRRGELAGVRWQDFDFAVLDIDVQRSVVDQVVGRCKTEASQKRIPLDEYTAQDLLAWFQQTLYRDPGDYVFAANSSRAGKKRGKQPLWLSTIMRYYIQPVVKRLGIKKRVTWHTFRRTYTTLLHANGEDVKVVQELLRHSSSRITMDIYAQAQMPAKRAAQQKVVEMVRSAKTAPEAKKMA
jgi:integrase